MAADSAQDLLDPKVLVRLQGFSFFARRRVEGYVSGTHRSTYHGFSVEFSEHREYAAGDDLRYLDWKVYGRTDKYYLKQFEEETNLVCHLLIDGSESMAYKSEGTHLTKLEYAQCAAAAMAYLILHQQDSVGLAAFDDEIRSLIRPSGNPSHLNDLLGAIREIRPRRKTTVGPVFHALAEQLKRRGVIIVLSDMFDEVDSIMNGLSHLRHRRHEVVLMHVLDPAELEFPFEQATLFRGLEQMPDVMVDPLALRKSYLAEFQRYLNQLKAGCRRNGIDYVLMRTDRSLELALSSFLASRK